MAPLTKFLALAAIAITATSALPTGDTDLATRDPPRPWCKPCPPEHPYCQCVPDPNPPESDIDDDFATRQGDVEAVTIDERDPPRPWCKPCPPEHPYCQCVPDPNPPESDIDDDFAARQDDDSADPVLEVRDGGVADVETVPIAEHVTADPPWCKPCPVGTYCQCVSDDNPPESDIDDHNLTTRQADGGYPGLACFPMTGTGVHEYAYMPPVEKFCQLLNPGYLHPFTVFYQHYDLDDFGNSVDLTITNTKCDDDAYFDAETCQQQFFYILGVCNTRDGPEGKNVGGTYYYGCEHYILQHSGPGVEG
ncbi:hypothetical protein PRZ48_007786 [Zasmidium cellare]|uniref:Uncharacterized protein n=1 Tax=Zasmidium cellare TaxID=395010 RepID=A0ABR0EK94_ZASCE|nr:hypothetical protein PRZ48_007786 [Zasmidium cellare]